MGFVVDKVALGKVFSEYFGFSCQSSFHQLLHNHHLPSGAGTIGQQWPTYQVDSVSPHPEKLKNKKLLSLLVDYERITVICNRLHGVISQKTVIFILMAVGSRIQETKAPFSRLLTVDLSIVHESQKLSFAGT
jgi:hypothetical protein